MALKQWCGNKSCSECINAFCEIDSLIPCSPDCGNLTVDGHIKIKECLEQKCDEVKYIFDMVGCTDQEVLNEYGEVAEYPYDV